MQTRPLTLAELSQYERLGRRYFPDEDWGSGMQRIGRLLSRWPAGIQAVRLEGVLAGYIALWPLTKEAAGAIATGQLQDADLDAGCVPERIRRPHPDWICSAIVAAPGLPSTRKEVVRALAGRLQTVAQENRPSVVYAHAATAAGRRFMLRAGFVFPLPAAPQLGSLTTL